MVTGGVEPTQESMKKWFSAGVKSVGMGSKLFPKDKIANEQWSEISEICRNTLQYIKEARA